MPDHAQKPLEMLAPFQELPADEQDPAQKERWLQLPGEKTLWFNRFMVYCSLGPKRSLQAAVAKEREKIAAIESSENDVLEEEASDSAHKQTRKNTGVTLVRSSYVPGSWNEACKTWRWVERARAYDRHVIEQVVQDQLRDIYEGLGSKEHRVWELNKMASDLKAKMHREGLSGHEIAVLAGRIQSIMKDIAAEMKTFDKQVAAFILTPQVERMYQRSCEQDAVYVSEVIQREIDRERGY